MRRQPGMAIAFTATRSTDMKYVKVDTAVTFDNVLVNEGGGYNEGTSALVAPMNGLYWVSTTFFTNGNPEILLKVNGNKMVCTIPGGGTSSMGAVLKLNQDDVVQPYLSPIHKDAIRCSMSCLCIFTGHLIAPLP